MASCPGCWRRWSGSRSFRPAPSGASRRRTLRSQGMRSAASPAPFTRTCPLNPLRLCCSSTTVHWPEPQTEGRMCPVRSVWTPRNGSAFFSLLEPSGRFPLPPNGLGLWHASPRPGYPPRQRGQGTTSPTTLTLYPTRRMKPSLSPTARWTMYWSTLVGFLSVS